MKFLFDENLSPKLPQRLAELFPDSIHVREVGLKSADDPIVWQYAKQNDLVIVSRTRIFIKEVLCSAIRQNSFG